MQFIGTTFLVLILIVAGFLIAAYIIYLIIKAKIKTAMPSFDIDNISELANTNKNEMENTPKSINGMESVLRPRVEDDFPDMSLEELKAKNKDEVFAYFSAIENLNITHFEKYPNVNDIIRKKISENKVYKKKFSNLKVHKQAMSDYRVLNNVNTISFQMAIEYMLSSEDTPEAVKTQSRVETQWIWLPDEQNFNSENAKAFNCPNCGAPVSDLNNRVCIYCQTSVEVDFTKSWRLNSILEK